MKSRFLFSQLDGSQQFFEEVRADSPHHAISGFRTAEQMGLRTTAPPEPSQPQRPHAVYVPEHYEANYPYPLIVWLHRSGGSEHDLETVMAEISTRNYLGLSLRAPLPTASPLTQGFRWPQSPESIAKLENDLYETVRDLRREYHIHTERIYVAGFGAGATTALQLMLSRPEWFAGAISLGGRFPHMQTPLFRFRDLPGKRVLLGTGLRDRRSPIAHAIHAGRLLYSAGIEVATRTYDAEHELTPKMLSDVNHWLMTGICTTNVV